MSDQLPPPGNAPDLRLPDDMDVRHCYRHPDRETGVSCSNCGKPICHECMIPAAVGFRCPDCVTEQRRSQGRAKVVTRGQIRSRWQGGLAGTRGMSVTKVLIGINVVVFLLEMFTGAIRMSGGGTARSLVDLGALVPAYVAIYHEYWRLFTSMFMHAGIFHLFFNMWALLIFGEYLEAVIGRAKFALLYFVAGFGGSVFIMLFSGPMVPTVGASGAIFGVLGGLAAYAYVNRRRDYSAQLILRNALFIIVINIVITAVGSSYISWQAHGGGLIAGAVAMAAMSVFGRKDPREPFEAADAGLLTGLVLVLLLMLVWRIATMPAMGSLLGLIS